MQDLYISNNIKWTFLILYEDDNIGLKVKRVLM